MKRLAILLIAMAGMFIQCWEAQASNGPTLGSVRFFDDAGKPYTNGHVEYAVNSYGAYYWKFVPHDVNNVKIFNQTWINQGATAETGASAFSISTYDPSNLKQPNASAAAYAFASKLADGALKAGDGANALATVEQADFSDLTKEALRVEVLKGLSIVASESKADQSRSVELRAEASTGGGGSASASVTDGAVEESNTVVALAAGIAASEKACLACHGGEAKNGDGVQLPKFAQLSKADARRALEYILPETEGCAVRAHLTADSKADLVVYLGKKS